MRAAPGAVADRLMARAVGARHGLVPAVHDMPAMRCDLPGVFHAVAPRAGAGRWDNPAGGVGWSAGDARRAATGEALERYAAALADLPAVPRPDGPQVLPLDRFALFTDHQRLAPRFPHARLFADHAAGGGTFTDVTDATGRQWWVPRFLVSLGDPAGHALTTSSGLAAGSSNAMARLRATQELVERDALMATWGHGVAGRRVALPHALDALVAGRGGKAVALDITPAFSPHPVALVAGEVPRRGLRRIAIGAACRATWEEAVDKAFLEWCQGVLFAGVYLDSHPGLHFRHPADVRTFEHHAAYYSAHPDRWDALPLLRGGDAGPPPPGASHDLAPPGQLDELAAALSAAGVRLFWRDVGTPDVGRLGVRVVRALSPDLTPISCDQQWLCLGGRSADLAWRYPWATHGRTGFPVADPHPLG